MKIIKIVLFLSTVVIAHTACKKAFLEKTDPTRISTNVFYKDSTQVEQAVNGIYSYLQTIAQDQWLYNEQPSDNTTIDFNVGNRGGAGYNEPFEYFTVNSGNAYISNLYNYHYAAIYNINNALKQMEGATLSASARAINEGQLQFIRGYLYFEMVQYWGDLILITEPLQTPSDAYSYNRKSKDSVYAQVIADLTAASQKLPASYPASGVGRATKGAALTLLGKVYLTMHKYSEAITALTPVLTLGYSLVPNYADVFDPAKKNGPESIFDIQFQGGNDLGEWSGFVYTFAPRNSGDSVTGFSQSSPAGLNTPTNDIINAYETGDLRKDASIGLNVHSKETGQVVPYIKKYAHKHTIYGRTDDNWPVLRYSDALLMLAEAINEVSGPTGDAVGYVNSVRTRAGLGNLSGINQQTFRDTIYHERRIELAFENWRWFDLKRTKTPDELTAFMNAYGAKEKANPTVSRGGVPFSNTDYVFETYEYYYPLPAKELQINSNLAQNPGY